MQAESFLFYFPNVTLIPANKVKRSKTSPSRATVHYGSTKALKIFVPAFQALPVPKPVEMQRAP
jgi:hypothetical protein